MRYLSLRLLLTTSGIIIIAILTWVVTLFGIKLFHAYERLVKVDKSVCYTDL